MGEKKKVKNFNQYGDGTKLPYDINMTPVGSWMITTAYIKPIDTTLFAGKNFAPTFLNMQQVLSTGPGCENVKEGDWVFLDMERFVKTTKKKSTIRAGIGGEEMIQSEFVPPLTLTPGDDTAFFKISDREIEGIVKDITKIDIPFMNVEEFVDAQQEMEKETSALLAEADSKKRNSNKDVRSIAPAIHGANSGGRKKR